MLTECPKQIRLNNLNTPLLASGRASVGELDTHTCWESKLANMSPRHWTCGAKQQDTTWATCWEEAPNSASHRFSLIYSNTLIETPSSLTLSASLKVKKGGWTKTNEQWCCCGMDSVVTAAALLLTHLMPKDLWIFGLRDCTTTLVPPARYSETDCQKHKYTYI